MLKLIISAGILLAVSMTSTGCSDDSETPSTPTVPEYTQVDFEPSCSRTVSRVVYAHSNINDELSGIYITNFDGTGKSHVVSSFARSPSFSSDDSRILFSQFGFIFSVKKNGDSLKTLTTSGKDFYPKYNYNDSLIAFSRVNTTVTEILQMNSDGSGITELDRNANYPYWSHSENILLYFKPYTDSTGAQKGDTLVKYNALGNTKTVLKFISGSEHRTNLYPVFAADEIVFCSMDSAGYHYIYKLWSDGTTITLLTAGQGYSPDYSEALDKIIYTDRDPGNGRLWMMNRDGSNKVQITN